MKKFWPVLYLIVGIFILINTFIRFFEDYETYRLIFSFKTESKYVFLLFRVLIASYFIVSGIKKLKKN